MSSAFLKTEAEGNDRPQDEWDVRDFVWDPIRGVAAKRTSNLAAAAQIHSEGFLSGSNQQVGVVPAHWGAQGSALKGPLVCQVAHCGKDLMEEKTYYRRHRIW